LNFDFFATEFGVLLVDSLFLILKFDFLGAEIAPFVFGSGFL